MRLLKRLVKILAWLLLGTLLILIVSGLAGIDIRLDPLKPAIELAAGKAINRTVTVNGPIRLTASFWPSLSVSDVQVANPPGWPAGDQLAFRQVQGQIALPPLLSGQLVIPSLSAEGVRLNFVRNSKGESNFSDLSVTDEAEHKAEKTTLEDDDEALIGFSELNAFAFRDVVIKYRDPQTDFNFTLDELTGSAPRKQAITMTLHGSVQNAPYAFEINGGPLKDLMRVDRSWELEISGNVAASKIQGTGALDPEKSPAEGSFELKVTPLDIGALLSHGIVDDLKARAGSVALGLKLRGDDPGEILALSGMNATISDGLWVLSDPNAGDFISIRINSGQLQARPGKPVTLGIRGTIDAVPVTIDIQTSELARLLETKTHVPVKLDIDTSGTQLALTGSVDMPIAAESMKMALSISGERLDTLNTLLDTALPPFGPYSLQGEFSIKGGNYRISELALHVGESDLKGSMLLATAGIRPNLDINLKTTRLQLNDFDTGDWSAFDDQGPTQKTPDDDADKRANDKTPKAGETQEALLSRDTLSQLDARLKLEVDEVVSGTDLLGKGLFEARLKDARLSLDPVSIKTADGGIDFRFDYEPTASGVEVEIFAHIDEFDYGNLARRAKPESDMGGLFSLDVALKSTAPSWEAMMTRANGHFDLAVWPLSFEAGVLDMWAVNIIAASAEQLDKDQQSVINCIVGRFDIKDGLLSEDAIVMDTSQLRVWGQAKINFKNEKLKIKLRPVAKKPEYFSLATPITLKGNIHEYDLKLPTGALVGTGIKFITSPIHASVRRLLQQDRLPKKGEDVCLAAMDRNVALKPPEPQQVVDEEMEPWD